jgi:hypothetical protein
MDPDNALRILRGEQFVDLIPERFRKEMAGRRITRLVKGEDGSRQLRDHRRHRRRDQAGRVAAAAFDLKPNTACRAS